MNTTQVAPNNEKDTFRPDTWDEYVGQPHIKTLLAVHCDAAKRMNTPLDHVFLAGPPGCGKTTLAELIAERVHDEFLGLIMPVNERVLSRVVQQFSGVLLLDEIHRSTHREQEQLLSLLEDGYMYMKSGRKIDAVWLTVVGATTEPENVIPPLIQRFPIRPTFDRYTPEELSEIASGMTRRLDIELPDEILHGIGVAAGGTPRNVRSLVTAARDLALVTDRVTLDDLLHFVQMTPDGLTKDHRNYLEILNKLGGRAGLEPIRNMLRMHPSTVRELERVLIDNEYIELTERGREATTKAYQLLNPIERSTS